MADKESRASMNKPASLLELLEWRVQTGCALHDLHNALKWSMHLHFSDAELLKDVYVIVEGILNSMGQLREDHFANWLVSHLSMVPDEQLPAADELRELWTALGADAEVTDILASELRLTHRDGRILVSAMLVDKSDVIGTVSQALQALWHFKKFTASRWCTVGTACRSLIIALLTGFGSLVQYARKQPQWSDYHLGAWDRLTPKVRRFVVLAGLSSYVPESVLALLMEDPRVLAQVPLILETLQEEMDFIDGLGAFTWNTLNSLFDGEDPGDFQAEVLSAGHRAIAYVNIKTLSEARSHPWSLAVGDMDGNLMALQQGPEPEEPVARKIWHLLRLGVDLKQVKQGLSLLLDCPWGTASAEQQHASGTIMRKFHPELGQESLMVRSLLHTLRHLMPQASREGRRLLRAQQALERLRQKNPERLSGRQMYVKDLMSVGKHWQPRPGQVIPDKLQKVIMQRHGKQWEGLSHKRKQQYEARAALARSNMRLELEQDILQAEAELVSIRNQQASKKLVSRPLLLSECKLTDDDEAMVEKLLKTSAMQGSQLEKRRKLARQAPAIISQELQKAIASVEESEPVARETKPTWLGTLCRNRDLLNNCALIFLTETEDLFFKFVFATQSPIAAYFSPMEPQVWYLPTMSWEPRTFEEMCSTWLSQIHKVDYMQTISWSDLPKVPESDMFVLQHLRHLTADTLQTFAEPVPLDVFLRWLPVQKAREPTSSSSAEPASRKRAAGVDAVLKQHPGLKHLMELPLHSEKAEGSSSEGEAGDEEQPVVSIDQALDNTFAELEKARERWTPADQHSEHFKVSLLGGRWTRASLGVAYDAFKAGPRGKEVEAWCVRHSLPRSSRYDVSAYGNEGAATLARAWAHRMQFLYETLDTKASNPRAYEDALKAYIEPEDFTNLASSLPAKRMPRVQQIRNLGT